MEGGRNGASGAAAVYRVAEVFNDEFVPVRILCHLTVERNVRARPFTSYTALHHVQVSLMKYEY